MNSARPSRKLRLSRIAIAAICAGAAMAASLQAADRGRDAFEKRCSGCHTLDEIKIGPPLRGVYGRNAGRDPQFPYSDAVRMASVKWDETTLDRWLADTESVIPENDMAFRLNDPVDRATIIAYLKKVAGQ